MNARFISFVAALIAIPCGLFAQKPVREGMTSVLYKQPPPTLAGLYAASEAVVVAHITSNRGVESVQPGGRVLTEVAATVTEIIKPNSQLGPIGSEVSFRVSGGEVDRGDHIERVIDRGQPPLTPGRDYLVALVWDKTENAFFPAFGPGAIFEVTGGVVKPQRNTTLAATVSGITSRKLIAGLKKGDPAVKQARTTPEARTRAGHALSMQRGALFIAGHEGGISFSLHPSENTTSSVVT